MAYGRGSSVHAESHGSSVERGLRLPLCESAGVWRIRGFGAGGVATAVGTVY